MLAIDPRLPTVALVNAAGLLLVALIAWLVPTSLAASGLILFGRETLAELIPALHAHRSVLLVLALVGGVTALIGYLEPPVPGVGVAWLLLLAAQVAALVVAAPLAVFVVVLLLLNLVTWFLIVRIGLAVLRAFVT